MPALTYSESKDPKTGETIWLPQLYPHSQSTGEMSFAEIEAWVSAGIIPRDLYESDIRERKKMEEIHVRLKNGEQVQRPELPNNHETLTGYLLKNKAQLYGENVLTRIFSMLNENDPDIVWLSYIKESIFCLKATNPLQIHHYVSRKILKEKHNIDDVRASDILARVLLEHCCNMINFKAFQHPAFNKLLIDISDLHDHLKHEKEQMLQIDMDFIEYLKKIGPKGVKLAAEVQKNSTELFEFYEKENHPSSLRRQLWGLWVPDNAQFSGALSLLAQALWEDVCFKLWYRDTNGAASIVKPIIERIIPLLGPKKSKKFIEKDGHIILCNQEGESLLMTPAVDSNMITTFKNGINELGTLTGHKMLRWQVKSGFERWAKGENDPRLIEVDGGYSRIAETIGCCNPREISKVRDILFAQAHGYFKFADGSRGNMIILNILNRHQNTEPSKIRIILGSMLLPDYIHQISGSERRLIPIGDLPPLHGSGNSHAAQAQLQLLIFSEFSNQSVRLAKEGSVLLPMEWWKEKAVEAGLNPEKVMSVIEHWCQPDFFNCFLEKQGDEFRLSSYYEKQQKFLENQGRGRIIKSENAKKGIAKKSARKFKKS